MRRRREDSSADVGKVSGGLKMDSTRSRCDKVGVAVVYIMLRLWPLFFSLKCVCDCEKCFFGRRVMIDANEVFVEESGKNFFGVHVLEVER